ncbi:MAG: hypothetical protein HY784_09710 [Chloroflexi bacterium]|nr:hypothetical protein [Chloroflexota bacterium]
MSPATAYNPPSIAHIVRDALTFDPKNWGSDGMNADGLPEAVARLFALLGERQVEYVLVGGVALLAYIEGRNTQDIDLIMALPSLKRLPEIEIQSQDVNFARGKFDELQIDLLLTRNRLFEQVLRRYAAPRRFAGRELPCATVEGLLLLKLYALPSLYREGSFARVGLYENDIATLMHAYRPAMEPLFGELAWHLSETDLAEVRSIVAEIRARMERFDRGANERNDI